MKQLLKEVAIISAGQGAPQGDDSYCEDGIPFVKAGNLLELLEGKSIWTIQKVSEEIAQKHKLKLYKKGTVLFAKSGMSCLKGYVYVLPCDAYVVSHLACITPKEDISDYLLFYFNYHKPSKLIKDEAYPSISLSDIGNLEIDLKKADERAGIVTILSQTKHIIDERKEQLHQLDELIKARFVEMFGDIPYEGAFPLVQLCELANVGSSKRIYANEYVDSGIPFYRSKEIRELGSGSKPSVELFIKQERYAEIKKKYGVPKVGDILIAAIGATIGYSWIVDTDAPFYYKDGNLIILSIKNGVNSIFLNYVMQILIDDFKKKGASGSAQLALTIEKLEKLMIPFPSIELQNQFADFVAQVDKSKFGNLNRTNKSLQKHI